MADKISSPDMPDVWIEVEFCHDLPYEIDGETADENLDRPVLSISFPISVLGEGFRQGRDTRSIILTRDGAHKLIDELNTVLRNERCIKSHGPKDERVDVDQRIRSAFKDQPIGTVLTVSEIAVMSDGRRDGYGAIVNVLNEVLAGSKDLIGFKVKQSPLRVEKIAES